MYVEILKRQLYKQYIYNFNQNFWQCFLKLSVGVAIMAAVEIWISLHIPLPFPHNYMDQQEDKVKPHKSYVFRIPAIQRAKLKLLVNIKINANFWSYCDLSFCLKPLWKAKMSGKTIWQKGDVFMKSHLER